MQNTKTILWSQYGASIDMLENAIQTCPEEVWQNPNQDPQDWYQYWYLVFHTLFWLDVALFGGTEGFVPPAPFGLEELDPKGVIPSRAYTKIELQNYLADTRQKCQATIANLTKERANEICTYVRADISFLELQLYNLRHVQHHVGQLHVLLRQAGNEPPHWVRKTK